jgi:hypothetical protein
MSFRKSSLPFGNRNLSSKMKCVSYARDCGAFLEGQLNGAVVIITLAMSDEQHGKIYGCKDTL